MADVEIDDGDDLFTAYDAGTHGDATKYTFTGFTAIAPETEDGEPSVEAFEVTFYGTDDVAVSYTWIEDEVIFDDGLNTLSVSYHDVTVSTGLLFAVEFNGVVPDDNLMVFPTFATLSDETVGSEFNAEMMAFSFIDSSSVDSFFEDDSAPSIIYLSGDTPSGDTGVPTVEEAEAFFAQFDDQSDTATGTVTFAASGTVTLASAEYVSTETTDIVPVMPESQDGMLCELFGEDFDYDAYVNDSALSYTLPTYMIDWSGPLMTLDGYVDAAQMLTQDYKDAVKAFADHLEDLENGGAGIGLRVYDFEDMNSGNFAGSASTYVADADDTVDHQTGDMSSGTANGALSPDDYLTVYLFNTGDSLGSPESGDDPGIATHEGNDADRGFNMSAQNYEPNGQQYLEVLPGETTHGGVVLCFDEPTYGFGFNLMGREDNKRDVFLDIHLSDGSIVRQSTDEHPNGTGGAQYVSYMIDSSESDGAFICAVVLYEPQQGDDLESNDRDIFAIDDLTTVVDEVNGTHTSDDMKDNTREAYVEEGPCDPEDDGIDFTTYDFETHGEATVFTLGGFGYMEYNIDDGGAGGDAVDGDDAPASIDPYTLTFYGSSDLALSHMLDPDWETLTDGSHPMDWDLHTGTFFAATINGVTIDPNYDVELELVDVYYDGGTPDDDTDDFSARILEINIDDGTGLSDHGFFYISGDMLGTDGVPTVEEFMTIGNALDEEAGPSSATYVSDDESPLILGDIDHVGIETVDSAVPVMPEVEVSMTLCCLLQDPDADYNAIYSTVMPGDPLPVYLNAYISDTMQLDGPVVEDQELSQDVVDTVTAFANAAGAMGGSYGLRIYNFEDHAVGNYADSTAGYTPAAGETVDNVSGDMASGTATGTLQPDGFAAFHLFDTGHSVGTPHSIGDDPGIATHEGNDADRGFNITASTGSMPDGSQYLEVLPSETDGGGLIVCFDGPTYGFGFHLMGREDNKRDVFLDVHLTDGTVHRVLTDTNTENTGGLQYYSFLVDVAEADGATIQGFVLFEPLIGEADASQRDIFSIDDLALVTDAENSTHGALDLIDLTRSAEDDEEPLIPLLGTDGDDLLEGGDAAEAIVGYDGQDTITGGGGDDDIEAGLGNDTVNGGDGDDDILAGGGKDTVRGDAGYDQINGMNGNDYLFGGTEDDFLFGSGGRDRLRGNNGDDTMEGGGKNDFLQGGAGADVFVFDTDDGSWGKDFIKDFELGVDRVQVEGFTADDIVWKAKADGTGVIAKFAGGGNIVFNNLTEGDLNDFSDWDFI